MTGINYIGAMSMIDVLMNLTPFEAAGLAIGALAVLLGLGISLLARHQTLLAEREIEELEAKIQRLTSEK